MADKEILTDGLVTTQQYNKLIKSDSFRQVEKFSDRFISKVGPMIQSYNIRWVADPLHQWSRQWEYLYIINRAQSVKKNARIVDLGAGVSFLPYYMKQKMGLKNILAVDYDKSLNALYDRVNAELDEKIEFQSGDMRHLKNIDDESVDLAYSVSVLEHTNSYVTVLKEIHRILKKGGQLSITFDISLDGLDDIPLARAEKLVAAMEAVFDTKLEVDLQKDLTKKNLVTSGMMAKKDRSLMPWKYPILNVAKHLLHHGKFGRMYKQLTFCCVTVTKK